MPMRVTDPIRGQSRGSMGQANAMLSLIRSLYLVGAILTAYGLTRWAWHYRDAAFPWRHNIIGREPFVPQERE